MLWSQNKYPSAGPQNVSHLSIRAAPSFLSPTISPQMISDMTFTWLHVFTIVTCFTFYYCCWKKRKENQGIFVLIIPKMHILEFLLQTHKNFTSLLPFSLAFSACHPLTSPRVPSMFCYRPHPPPIQKPP